MESNNRPNLVYIFADQWRRQAVGYEEEDQVITPNIDAFSKEGTVFSNALTVSPLCSPHRASLLTGKYPINTGVFTNCKVGADVMLQPDETCISDVLADSGYETCYIGKWHLDLPELNVTDKPASGAKGWDAYTPPGPKRHGFRNWYSYGAWDDHLSPHYWGDSPEKIKVQQWSVEHETDKAIEFIEKRDQEKAFALFVSWNPPHSPFDQVPDKYRKVYEGMDLKFRKNVEIRDPLLVHTGEHVDGGEKKLKENQLNYFAAITGIDEQFGRILELLKEKNLDENTIVVLTSDHGEMMGSHGLMAKHVWYEESIGVPFIIRWPNKIPKAKSDVLLNTVDIMPTILSLMNLATPDSIEGTDLSDFIIKQTNEGPEYAYISCYPGRKEALEQFQEAGVSNLGYGWRAIRTKEYLYVIHNGYSPEDVQIRLFYKLMEDKFQQHPEVIREPIKHPIVSKLEGKLCDWLNEMNDPFLLYHAKKVVEQ